MPGPMVPPGFYPMFTVLTDGEGLLVAANPEGRRLASFDASGYADDDAIPMVTLAMKAFHRLRAEE